MDQIVKGFLRKIGHLIKHEAEVREIQLVPDGVEIIYKGQHGSTVRAQADYCISNIPLPILQNIPANFSDEYKNAVAQGRFDPTCKVGWQANERFWESERYQFMVASAGSTISSPRSRIHRGITSQGKAP
jgi:monoamine oxidase